MPDWRSRSSGTLFQQTLEAQVMTIETEDEYQAAVIRLKALADIPDGERDQAEFLDISAAMVTYETRLAKPAEG